MSGIAAAQAATPQIPFWLQILTISLSPVLGFIGVAVGVLLNGRSRRNAYVKDERRKVYRDYLEILSQITIFYGTDYLFAMRHAKNKGLAGAAAEKASLLSERLQTSYLHVRLIGSPDAIDAASQGFELMASAGMVTALTLEGEYNRSDWDPVIRIGVETQARFTEVARKDLGLPRKEVSLPPTGEPAAPTEEQKFIRETLVRVTSAEGGPLSQPQSTPQKKGGS